MPYLVLYGGLCNLCVTGIQLLEQLDRGQQFCYAHIKIPLPRPNGGSHRQQICCPFAGWGASFPSLKLPGDRGYELVRDHRYEGFGYCDDLSAHLPCERCRDPLAEAEGKAEAPAAVAAEASR
jgi:predicted DCC family thiol-disulfide oxidoreductase YuxK